MFKVHIEVDLLFCRYSFASYIQITTYCCYTSSLPIENCVEHILNACMPRATPSYCTEKAYLVREKAGRSYAHTSVGNPFKVQCLTL